MIDSKDVFWSGAIGGAATVSSKPSGKWGKHPAKPSHRFPVMASS